MPSEECCILFLHHNDDEVTRNHYQILQENNPYPIVPLHTAQERHLENAIDVGPLENGWINADLPYYRWFLNRSIEAKRYVWIEYDTLATQPLKEFYGHLWDADAVGSTVRKMPRERRWYWFRSIPRLPESLRPYAMGVSPLSCVLLSHAAFTAITQIEPPPVYCELRLGTLLNHAGINIQSLPHSQSTHVHWEANLLWFDRNIPGVYHPVKTL